MKTIAFFNNKSGVGKTTLLYHLAWMFSDLGIRTVAVDLDPQSNLTSMFLAEERLEELGAGSENAKTIVGAVAPLLEEGASDVKPPYLETPAPNLALVPGDLGLARMEDEFNAQWPKSLDGSAKAFRITAAFHRVVQLAAEESNSQLALLDTGPFLGAFNRCALIASDYVAIPLVPDLFMLQGLSSLGSVLRKWREGWKKRLMEMPETLPCLPRGHMKPVGYVVTRHTNWQSPPAAAYSRRADRIPSAYRSAMEMPSEPDVSLENDPNCLAQIKSYRSLMPLAMEARKPVFHLTPADGAIGAHAAAVADCRRDFEHLARRIAQATKLDIPKSEFALS